MTDSSVGNDGKLGIGTRSESSLIGCNGNPKNEKLFTIKKAMPGYTIMAVKQQKK